MLALESGSFMPKSTSIKFNFEHEDQCPHAGGRTKGGTIDYSEEVSMTHKCVQAMMLMSDMKVSNNYQP